MQSHATETNQILWFYSFFRFSIWKNHFQLSALPLFTLLRGPWAWNENNKSQPTDVTFWTRWRKPRFSERSHRVCEGGKKCKKLVIILTWGRTSFRVVTKISSCRVFVVSSRGSRMQSPTAHCPKTFLKCNFYRFQKALPPQTSNPHQE